MLELKVKNSSNIIYYSCVILLNYIKFSFYFIFIRLHIKKIINLINNNLY